MEMEITMEMALSMETASESDRLPRNRFRMEIAKDHALDL